MTSYRKPISESCIPATEADFPYGYEGSVTAAVLITAAIIVLIYMMHKKNRPLI